MKYKLIIEDSIQEVEKQVTELINNGWHTTGGIALSFIPDDPVQLIKGGLYYAQALEK